MATVGIAPYSYEVVEGWGKLPPDWTYREAAAVGVDSKDNVYVFCRGEHPIIVYDKDGNFLRSWGEDLFRRAHGITLGPDDTIYCTDDEDHTVRKCTLDGRVLLTLGVPGQPTPFMSGDPFNKCTHVALDPQSGDIYVSVGYCNAKVHKYSPDGKLLFSWGEPGTGPSEFNIVHNIATDKDGWVYVADRENHRIQVFDRNGRFETQWNNMSRPCGLYIDPKESQTVYVGEFGSAIFLNADAPGLGPRVSLMDTGGNTLARLGDGPMSEAPGRFIAPHGVSVDSEGSIYVAEVSWTIYGRNQDPPREVRTIQKLALTG